MHVVAEMAASVWRIEHPTGSDVAADDVVLVLESMKMEIPVVAPLSGTLTGVFVIEGEQVVEGQPLFELTPGD